MVPKIYGDLSALGIGITLETCVAHYWTRVNWYVFRWKVLPVFIQVKMDIKLTNPEQPLPLNLISSLILFGPGFSPFKGPGGGLLDPLKSQEQFEFAQKILRSFKAYQNTLRNFQKADLWRHNGFITRNNRKIRTSVKPGKWYIIRKVMIRAFRKCNFYCNWSTESKRNGH